MGLSESSSIKSYNHFIASYEYVTNLSHPNFGEISIYEHRSKSDSKIIQKLFLISDESVYQKAIKLLELKLATKWPFYCQILSFCYYQQYSCTNTGFAIKIAVEYFERNVYQAGLGGCKTVFMHESSAWRILTSVVQLASFVKRYNLSIGEISPENVLLNEKDDVKFMDMHLLTLSTSIFDRLKNRNILTNFALSPEQLEQIRNSSNHEIDNEKSDVFCIGMFIICAVLSEPFKNFYDYSTYEIDFQKIFKKILKLKKAKFSDEFTDILVSMIQKNPKNRHTSKQLYNHIQHTLRTSNKSIGK